MIRPTSWEKQARTRPPAPTPLIRRSNTDSSTTSSASARLERRRTSPPDELEAVEDRHGADGVSRQVGGELDDQVPRLPLVDGDEVSLRHVHLLLGTRGHGRRL